ncbi:MAG: OmpA family protein [Pseudoalteromonas distincta]|jgi:outer membrane protein OmpA-like peptidoglycan-associated protein|tara:strand:- start:12029 stop:12586 length:558 start_codon:yes stop_codon:yes gene_type:complete
MKTLKTLSAVCLSLALAACASKAPVEPTPPPPPPPSWAESRVEPLTAIAEKEGFEVVREGEQIRLIIPVEGNFHPKRTLLLPSGLVPLSKIAKALKEDTDSHYAVVGHSDSTGEEAQNEQLSMERAQAVASILMLGGVSGKRMSLTSMGENQPRADNSTYTGRMLNRRVEILMTPYPTRVAMVTN